MDLLLAIFTLFIRVGYSFYAMGMVRAKSSAGTVVRLLADLCVSVLAFWLIGAAILLYQGNSIVGLDQSCLPVQVNWDKVYVQDGDNGLGARTNRFFHNLQVDNNLSPVPIRMLLNLSLILAATVAVSGAVAERSRFFPLMIASAVLAGLVLPVTGFWIWGGWLERRGFIDIGGSCGLQLAAGAYALAGLFFCGPRRGKFNRDGSSSLISGHNIPIATMGIVFIIVGWVGYVGLASLLRTAAPGRENLMPFFASAAVLNTLLAAAAAGFASIIYCQVRFTKPDILVILTGILGGLVTSAASGYAMPRWGSVLSGALGGLIVCIAVVRLDLQFHLDDPLGLIGIQIIGGAWGVISTGLLIPRPLLPSRIQQLGIQFFGLIVITGVAAMAGVVVFGLLAKLGKLKIRESAEYDGLDLTEHDITAYPDFQTSSIHSYGIK